MDTQNDSSKQADKEKDVEKLLQEAIVEDGGTLSEEYRQVNIGMNQVASLSSFNYDELNEDNTLMFASEWNLNTEDFDDEEMLVVSQPNSASESGRSPKPRSQSKLTKRQLDPTIPPPMISSEDDDTLINSSLQLDTHNIVSTDNDHSFGDSKIDFREIHDFDDDDGENDKEALIEDEAEASRRYLTINSAPLYRWSEGMLPSISKQRLLQHQDRILKRDSTEEDTGEGDDEYDFGPNSEYIDQEEEKKMFLDSVRNGPSIPAIGEATSAALKQSMQQPGSLKSPWIVERLKHLAKAYNDRTTFVKKAIDNLSESDDSETSDDESERTADGRRKENFTFESIFGDELDCLKYEDKVATQIELIRRGTEEDSGCHQKAWTEIMVFFFRLWCNLTSVFEPQTAIYVSWLFILAMAFSYNSIMILFRAVFPYEIESETDIFFLQDCIFDIVYLLDIVWFKPHLKFIKNGQWIDDPKLTRNHYLTQKQFKYDFAAILPIDLILWLYFGGYNVRPAIQRLSRFNRMLKIDSFWEFFVRIDAITTKFPYLFRIVHTLCYKMYIIHLGACSYYLCSMYEGFGETPWTYDNEGNAYLRCFYFAFRTTTSIGGRLPKPNNLFERIYMTVAWLLGVFVFAMVIGQIRDIVANAARDQSYYRDVLNKTANYMRVLSVPPYVQNRVRFWLNFTWDLQKTFNENEILRVLPLKSRTDIALSVHYQTLARVELFKNIDRSVLRDLVLKLRPILFLPNDYICRKGDVGHEMYIVNKGKIQVLSADGSVLIALSEGCVFGEIAILNLEGFTRRTADVRSVGYSQLFALSKTDLWETLKNYPEYQTVLKRKVQRILRKKRQQQNKDKDEAKHKRKHKLKSRQNTVEMDEPTDQAQTETFKPTECHVQIVPETIIPTVEIVQYEDEDDEMRDKIYDELQFGDDDDDEVFGGVASGIEVESIVKDRPKTPKLFDAVMEAIRPDSKVKGYFSRSQSFSSYHQSQSLDDDHFHLQTQHSNGNNNNHEIKIKVEDNDSLM